MEEENRSRGLISMRSMSCVGESIAGAGVADDGLFVVVGLVPVSSDERVVAISRNRACIVLFLFF